MNHTLRPRIFNIAFAILACILVCFIYSNILDAPFVFDDIKNIRENKNIRIETLTPAGLIKAVSGNRCQNRPAAYISFAINYYIHGYDTKVYHMVNILIHLITGILIFFLFKSTILLSSNIDNDSSGRKDTDAYIIAGLAATLWMVHPLSTQSVTYIVQRMNAMAAMFYVGSMLAYVQARASHGKLKVYGLYLLCGLSGLLAITSKEIAITLPIFIFLYEWYFLQDLDMVWIKRRVPYIAAIITICLATAIMFLGINPIEGILDGYTTRQFTPLQRVLTEFRVVILYIGLMALPLPSRLNLDYDMAVSTSLIDPVTTLLSLMILIALTVFAVVTAKKQRIISFAICWFMGNLVIESSIIGLELVYEHRTYLPSMFVSLMAIYLLWKALRPKIIPICAACLLIALFSVWTYQRNDTWTSDISLWRDCAMKSPGKLRPWYNLGLVLAQDRRHDEAAVYFIKALAIDNKNADAHNNLGASLTALGRLDDAIGHYIQALEIEPSNANAHNNLGTVLTRKARYKKAEFHFKEAVRIRPSYADACFNLGVLYQIQGRTDEALVLFEKAIQYRPDHINARMNKGIILYGKGAYDKAEKSFRAVLRIDPDNRDAIKNIRVIQNNNK